MFDQLETTATKTRTVRGVSVAAHALLLAALVWPARPQFIEFVPVAAGNGGTSTEIVYLAARGAENTQAHTGKFTDEKPRISLPAPRQHKPKPASPADLVAQDVKVAEHNQQADRAGMSYGTLANGPLFGPDVRPALPMVFSDPKVFADELPPGTQGNVVVEITIDDGGNIIDMKLVQGLGYGADERVLTALKKWHFHPATRYGVPIASKQYASFHFPST